MGGIAPRHPQSLTGTMADIVNLNDRLKAQREEDAKYAARMELTAKMIPIMVETVEKFNAMGAQP
jgi:hypothetical protein